MTYTVQQHRDHYGDQQEEGDEADGDHWNIKRDDILQDWQWLFCP